jgi:hypothetical protein
VADITVEEVVTRNCEALVAGNFAQIFADMTPEAMAKLSQLAGAQATAGTMPRLTGYVIKTRERVGDDHVYDVQFQGDVIFGVRGRWRAIDEQWKLVDFDAYQVEMPGGGTAVPPAG